MPNLDYIVHLIKDPDGFYYVEIPELSGCSATGKTTDEALDKLKKAKKKWLREAAKEGREIPRPEREKTYSGRFVLRLDKELHEKLSKEARKQDVSLNSYLIKLILTGRRNVDYEGTQESLRELITINKKALDLFDRALAVAEHERTRSENLTSFIDKHFPAQVEPTIAAVSPSVHPLKVIQGGITSG